MAMKTLINFLIRFVGDGASKTAAVTLAVAPVNTATAVSLASLVPTGVIGLTSSDGQAVTATIALGICTFTWPVPVPDQAIVEVYGQFVF